MPPTELIITGRVFESRDDALESPMDEPVQIDSMTLGPEEFDVLQPGDVVVEGQLDAAGRAAVSGGHANRGYSGLLSAVVWDGENWRRLFTHNMFEYQEVKYATQEEKASLLAEAQSRIEQLAGRVVEYKIPDGKKSRSYVLRD